MALPGVKINTSPTDFYPIEQEQLAKFDGERWVLFGEIFDASKKAGSPPATRARRVQARRAVASLTNPQRGGSGRPGPLH